MLQHRTVVVTILLLLSDLLPLIIDLIVVELSVGLVLTIIKVILFHIQ